MAGSMLFRPIKVNTMKYIFVLMGLLFSMASQASVIVNATRVVYPSDAKFVNVQLVNRGTTTHLVQSWIDDGNVCAVVNDPNGLVGHGSECNAVDCSYRIYVCRLCISVNSQF